MNFDRKILDKARALGHFSEKDLFKALGIKLKSERDECRQALKRLVEAGELVRGKKGSRFAVAEKTGLIKGRVDGNRHGFAFIIREDGGEDIFVPARNLHGAMHRDLVLCRLTGNGGRSAEGEVVSVLERGTDTLVGTYLYSHGYGFVEPDDIRYYKDIFIPQEARGGARNGQKVVVKIIDYPDFRKNPEGKIIEVLGETGSIEADILSIMRSFDLYEEFNGRTLRAAARAPQGVSEDELAGREDFRDDVVITIDGEDAKDLDDAISISKDGEDFILGVHIADVSHYVEEGSPLDTEALKRGTSVYFPDRVLPMLPRELSNGICSLHPGVDRLTLSVIMRVNSQGKVTSSRISKSVIRSKARMTYASVQKILDGDEREREKYPHLLGALELMRQLAEVLISKRGRRGSIDFDLPECKVILREDGEVAHIAPYPRGMSNRIIEEFMILANETVAETFFKKELPFVYRIHEEPSVEKLLAFQTLLKSLGYRLNNGSHPSPSDFAMLLAEIEGKPEYPIINKVMLRTMMKARYSPDCIGHFGLASKYYCHFTSPIRRYPDLMIHRIIKRSMDGDPRLKQDRMRELVREVSLRSSERERVAEESEREIDDYYKARFMEKRIGEEYEGVISGVTDFGIFVELPNTVEGMVRIESLPRDVYKLDKELYLLKGKNHSFRLGEKVRVKVEYADARTRRIDFSLI